jgi:trimeric autotransporter adhesin
MSTKTTFKRIALVAVASLGFGVLTSVAPANAMTSFTISRDSASSGVVKCSQSLTSNASVTITAGGGACLSDALTPAGTGVWAPGDTGYFGAIASNAGTPFRVATLAAASPAQAVVPLAFYTGTRAATTVASGIVANTITGMTTTVGSNGLLLLTLNAAITGTAAVARMTIGGTVIGASDVTGVATDTRLVVPFTAPITAGTYSASVQVSRGGSYTGTGADTFTQSFTLTVAAASDLDLGLSTAFMTTPTAGGVDASSTTNAAARTAVSTAGTHVAQVKVTLLRANGTADARAHRIDATVSGVGYVVVNTTADTDPNSTARASNDSSANNIRYVHIEADGNAGTGTVTVTVTHVDTGVRSTLGTFNYTTFGAVAALAISSTLGSIGLAGGDSTGQAVATRTVTDNAKGLLDDTTTRPAFIVAATDSAGRPANAASAPTIVSSASTVVASGTCVLDNGTNAGARSSVNGVGFYNCAFVTAATSKSGDKATLTIRIVDPADATKFITTTFDVTVGGTVATETIALDKATYAPGEAMVVTRTAVDSAGNPVADGVASPAVSFTKAIGGTAPTAGFYRLGASASATSVATSGLFAPVVAGAFTARATSGNAAATALTTTATVVDEEATAGVAAAADAAAEATDAANAATDAANAAAEAADAATAAAQDAADAVAALSTSVTAMVDSLRKQITSLTNLVIKIQRKVRA